MTSCMKYYATAKDVSSVNWNELAIDFIILSTILSERNRLLSDGLNSGFCCFLKQKYKGLDKKWLFFCIFSGITTIGPDVTRFPPFLRIHELALSFRSSYLVKQQYLSYLQTLQPVLCKQNSASFKLWIDKDYVFKNHSEFLEFLTKVFLPVCSPSRGCEFEITLWEDRGVATNIISSIFRMPQINRCSKLEFRIFNARSAMLPVEDISEWLKLDQKCDGSKGNSRGQEDELFLEIVLETPGNLSSTIEHLKRVKLWAYYC